jgi:hypothetical protein
MQPADEITALTETFPPAKYFMRDQLNLMATAKGRADFKPMF